MALTDEEGYLGQRGQVCDQKRGKWEEFSGNSNTHTNSRKCSKSSRQVCFRLHSFFFPIVLFQKRETQLALKVWLDNSCYSFVAKPWMQPTAPLCKISCPPLTSDTVIPANWHFSFPGMLLSSPRFSEKQEKQKKYNDTKREEEREREQQVVIL